MKVLTLKNNVTDSATLEKGMAIVKQWLVGIVDIDFVTFTTDKQFTSLPFSNDVNNNGYHVNPLEIFQEAKTFPSAFDIALLIYDWTKVTPRPTNPSTSGMNMQIPIQWYVTFPEVFAEFFLHELCHHKFQEKGLPDITHNYDPAFSQKPRKDWYLYLLSTLIPAPKIKTVVLTRNWDNGVQTLGDLTIGTFACKTLELPWRGNQKNISCIPKGTYLVKKVFSLKFGFVYEVQNVPGRAGIYFHKGNFYTDILGCILLGTGYGDLNKDAYADIVNSTSTVKQFMDLLKGEDFNLVIK